MDNVLQGCEEQSAAYLDDVIVYNKTWADHLMHLQQTLEKIHAVGLFQNVTKCEWAKQVQGLFIFRGYLCCGRLGLSTHVYQILQSGHGLNHRVSGRLGFSMFTFCLQNLCKALFSRFFLGSHLYYGTVASVSPKSQLLKQC